MSTSPTDQKDWIEAARSGEAEAISYLYNEHKQKVFQFIFYRLGNQADAEDLFQDVMVAAFESLERFRGEVSFLHWCYQIARNKVAYFWRKKGEQSTVELDESRTDKEADMESEVDRMKRDEAEEKTLAQKKEQLMSVLKQLPDNYRQILELRFLQEKTIKESAEAMKISESNAKVLQHRALKKASQMTLNSP